MSDCLLCVNRVYMQAHDELWSRFAPDVRPDRDDVNFWCGFLTGVMVGAQAGDASLIRASLCEKHRELAARADGDVPTAGRA